jgi:lipopolysaccharide export system permease protein
MLFEQLISDGQSAWVVLEFTALTLPNVIRLVLPVAAFAATIYAFNRLAGESELVVMQATGASPWRLARPVAVFGLIVALLMALLVHVLVPAARARLSDREAQVADNVTARFLTEGAFQHPAAGVTLYIRDVTPAGELLDLFLSDSRPNVNPTIYTARKALLVRGEAGPKLLMFDGAAQSLRAADGRLSLTRFADFAYDIGALITVDPRRQRRLAEYPTPALIAPDPAFLAASGETAASVRRQLHDRITQPLLAPVAALIGLAALLAGGFSRFGLWRQIVLAIAGLIGVQLATNLATGLSARAPEYWPTLYLPAALGIGGALFLLWHGARPRRAARRRGGLADVSGAGAP